jgi:Pectinacetylesterase
MHKAISGASLLLFIAAIGHVGGCSSSSAPSAASTTDAGATGDDASTTADSGATGTDGAAGNTDAAIPGYVPGAPITATAGQWTWVPFPDSTCGNGSPTGIGVNLSTTGTRALIYLEGGGACWSSESCYGLGTAANFTTGYSQADFQADSTDPALLAAPGSFFDRTAADNPFKDYSFVYVPYCTGDIFAGNAVATLGTNTAHFSGYTNFTSFLDRVVPTFSTADRIILAGSSAGGYGALINWDQTQKAFGSVRVDLIDDSGTFMPPDIASGGSGNIALAISVWDLASIVPSDCTTCISDPTTLWGYYAQKYSDHRAALLSYTLDTTLPTYYGISTTQFATGLGELLTSEFTPNPSLHAFVDNGMGHVLFFSPTLMSGTATVQSWVTQMVTDDAAWTTVDPSTSP